MQIFTNHKPTTILIPSYQLAERTCVDRGRYFLTIRILRNDVQSNQQEDTHNHALRRSVQVTKVCCCLTVLQTRHDSGQSSLWAFPCLGAKPGTSPLHPRRHAAPGSGMPLQPLHPPSHRFTSVCSAPLCFFSHTYQR